MILLIGMLFIKEEETRGTFVSTLYTTSSQSGTRRNQPFSLLLGEGVSNVHSTEKDNTFLHESHREREERIKEREREGKHSQDELHEEPDEPKHDKPCERERIRERKYTTVSAKREMKMLSDRKAKCI